MSTPIIIGIIALVIVVLIPSTVKILKEYERGVIFRLGRLLGTKGPGFFLIIPFVDQMTKRDLRVVTMDVTPQEVITKDNITVRVNAVIYFRVVTPEDSVVNVNDYIRATSQIAQTTLRNVLGQSELDELLTQREKLNLMLQKIIDEHTDPWGIKVATVEIKEVELPEQMRRMMAAQAEAERERRAKIIHAEGEFQASEKLAEAGAVIAREPVTLQLRYLQTLTEIATEKNSTVIFPLPMDLINMFMERGSGKQSGESDSK
jgi:regulator of protease activity HflC (stomatin/prohibitin superfamily)